MMKQVATGMALALMCLPAMAESEVGFYSGASVGQVTLKDNINGLGVKETGTGYGIFGGYRFNEYGSLEIAYVAGSGDDRVSGVTIETDASAIQGSRASKDSSVQAFSCGMPSIPPRVSHALKTTARIGYSESGQPGASRRGSACVPNTRGPNWMVRTFDRP